MKHGRSKPWHKGYARPFVVIWSAHAGTVGYRPARFNKSLRDSVGRFRGRA